MGFYEWRFRISLATREGWAPAPRLGGAVTDDRGAERPEEASLLRPPPLSGFLSAIWSRWRRRRGASRSHKPPLTPPRQLSQLPEGDS
jgi:hypothetical protein